jgi:hypothetical protein
LVALLSACAGQAQRVTPGALSPAQTSLLEQDQNRNGVLDHLERAQSTKSCSQEPCDLTVRVKAQASKTRLGGTDCGVSVEPDVLMFGQAVSRLRWTLQLPEGSSNEYRFRPQGLGGGLVVYANPDNRYFTVAEATPLRIVLARGQRAQEAYHYGIYLEWKPKGSNSWQACNPLDPVIIEHN